METPLTAENIRAAYRALYMATANAMDAVRQERLAQEALKDAEQSRVWVGSNDAERKANMRDNTVDVRIDALAAANALAVAQREQVLAKLVVDELHDLLRLAEYEQAAVDMNLTRVGLRELPSLLRLAEAMEDKPVLPIDK
jgi:hypothetical protein